MKKKICNLSFQW